MNPIELLNAKRFVIYNKLNNEILFETDEVYPQHFYPLSIMDFALAIKRSIDKNVIKLPILSISSKDYPYCDFKCKDCLAQLSRSWAQNNISELIPGLEKYKRILTDISEYSKNLGINSVRFEMCGEGNPDLYKGRTDLIRHAKEKCNMGIVYISTGSKLTDDTKDALAKYASYIRISFPGIDDESYNYYSEQAQKDKFKYEDALKLLGELIELRKKYNREKELVIGVRTCIRSKNYGKYIPFVKKIGEIGVDSLQIVKILTPEKDKISSSVLDEDLSNELIEIKQNYQKYGLKHIQIPIKLDKIYNDRRLVEDKRFKKCYSSLFSPILYGTNLITCTHWDKITDKDNFHYGILSGVSGEIDEFMNSQFAYSIRKKIPSSCNDCCSINDNIMFEKIENILLSCDNLDDIGFKLV